ncbi:hypothetical protein ABZV64_06420 [Streptomyces sp. NPDC004959]|uniref:hypothetical protein n=1 Tax=Streptomyces sp. NPDC004959 TaxID=3154673 RepID=UPI0033A82735
MTNINIPDYAPTPLGGELVLQAFLDLKRRGLADETDWAGFQEALTRFNVNMRTITEAQRKASGPDVFIHPQHFEPPSVKMRRNAERMRKLAENANPEHKPLWLLWEARAQECELAGM